MLQLLLLLQPTAEKQNQKPKIGSRMPTEGHHLEKLECSKPETKNRKAETKNEKPQSGSRKQETGSRKPEAGNQTPEAGNRKPETVSQ